MKTILVVDDENLVRWSLAEGLGDRFRVRTAGSVDQALAVLVREPVDAVLTDLRLPGRGGMELVEILRAGSPEVRIFILASGASDQVVDRALALDVAAIIRKPFGIDLVRGMLESHLAEPPRDGAGAA